MFDGIRDALIALRDAIAGAFRSVVEALKELRGQDSDQAELDAYTDGSIPGVQVGTTANNSLTLDIGDQTSIPIQDMDFTAAQWQPAEGVQLIEESPLMNGMKRWVVESIERENGKVVGYELKALDGNHRECYDADTVSEMIDSGVLEQAKVTTVDDSAFDGTLQFDSTNTSFSL